jgi:bacterioferritin-associated ferredoxin
MDQIICYCNQIDRAEIEKAILVGAKTLKDIQRATGACTGNRCKELNPSGKCCSADINAMLTTPQFKETAGCGCESCKDTNTQTHETK